MAFSLLGDGGGFSERTWSYGRSGAFIPKRKVVTATQLCLVSFQMIGVFYLHNNYNKKDD